MAGGTRRKKGGGHDDGSHHIDPILANESLAAAMVVQVSPEVTPAERELVDTVDTNIRPKAFSVQIGRAHV